METCVISLVTFYGSLKWKFQTRIISTLFRFNDCFAVLSSFFFLTFISSDRIRGSSGFDFLFFFFSSIWLDWRPGVTKAKRNQKQRRSLFLFFPVFFLLHCFWSFSFLFSFFFIFEFLFVLVHCDSIFVYESFKFLWKKDK